MNGKEFLEFSRMRASTRLFMDRAVPLEVIKRVIASGIQAPTSCNRQLWHFVVITDKAMKEKVSCLSSAQQSYLYDAPVLIAVFYDISMEAHNPCRCAELSSGMASYGMLLAAEAEGLGAIFLGGIRKPAGIEKAVGAPSFLKNLGLICLGYSDDDAPLVMSRPVDDVISYNVCDLKKGRCHHDIRPHKWSLTQLADFREKILWYKGIGIDGQLLHVDNEPRFSALVRYITGRMGMMISKYSSPKVLDAFSFNGDLLLQMLNTSSEIIDTLYAYDLTEETLRYPKERFKFILSSDKLKYVCNADPDKIVIPLENNSMDCILCYDRLGHFDDPAPFLRELYRVLKPGGRILVTISNRFYPHIYRYSRTRKKVWELGRLWNRGPDRKFEPQKIQKLFQDLGFEIVSSCGFQMLESKVISILSGFCRKLKLYSAADYLMHKAQREYCSSSLTKYASATIIYEITKN